MVKYDWFRYFDLGSASGWDQIVQSWDTASKPGNLNDYSVCTTWGISDKRFHLLNVYRKRVGYPELKQAVVEQARLYQPETILIEEKSSGIALIQDLISDGIRNIRGYRPKDDKVMRMHAQTATIENGFVFLPRQASWVADYLHEMSSFPLGKHDDQVDSTSQFLDWAKAIDPYIIVFARQQVQALHRAQEHGILMKRPAAGPGTVYFGDGTHANVAADGTLFGESGRCRTAHRARLDQNRISRISRHGRV